MSNCSYDEMNSPWFTPFAWDAIWHMVCLGLPMYMFRDTKWGQYCLRDFQKICGKMKFHVYVGEKNGVFIICNTFFIICSFH